MTKYFMRDTPLAALERQMMTPPNFSPRGGGQMFLCRFQYGPDVCKNHTKYRRKVCTAAVCPWIGERAEDGTVSYSSLAADYYRRMNGTRLGERISRLLLGKDQVYYYDQAHESRLLGYYSYLTRHWDDASGSRRLAAMYLLTATEPLQRCIPYIFEFWTISVGSWNTLRKLNEQEYALYQAAKEIYLDRRGLTMSELSDRELVDDTALMLILDAQLIAHYGKAMLTIGKAGGAG